MNRSYVKKLFLFLFVFVVSIFVRFPRTTSIIGTDGWYLIKESILFITGESSFIIHPLSFFGMYTFSSYPVGSLILYGIFYYLSFKNIFVATWMYISFLIILGTISSYLLFKQIFEETPSIILSLIYVNLPYIAWFSYYIPSARFPFYSTMPFLILFLIKYLEDGKIYQLFLAGIIFIILNTFHRMAIVTVVCFYIIGIQIFRSIFSKYFKNRQNKHIKQKGLIYEISQINNFRFFSIFLLFIVFVLVLLNAFFLREIMSLSNPESRIINQDGSVFSYLATIAISILFRGWGPVIFLSIIGFVMLFEGEIDHKINFTNFKNISYTLLPLILFIQNIYIVYILAIFPIVFTGVTISYLSTKKHYNMVSNLIMIFFTIFAYAVVDKNFFDIGVYFYSSIIIGSICLLLYLILLIVKSKIKIWRIIKTNIRNWTIVALLIYYSFFFMDFQSKYVTLPEYSPGYSLTDEEKMIALFLSNYSSSLIDSYSRIMGARIATLSDTYQLSDVHTISLVQTGYYKEEIILNESQIKPIWRWWEQYIFNSSLDSSRNIYSKLIQLNLTRKDAQNFVRDLGLDFFISLKDYNVAEQWINYFIESDFVKTLNYIGNVVYETEHYQVWNITI